MVCNVNMIGTCKSFLKFSERRMYSKMRKRFRILWVNKSVSLRKKLTFCASDVFKTHLQNSVLHLQNPFTDFANHLQNVISTSKSHLQSFTKKSFTVICNFFFDIYSCYHHDCKDLNLEY